MNPKSIPNFEEYRLHLLSWDTRSILDKVITSHEEIREDFIWKLESILTWKNQEKIQEDIIFLLISSCLESLKGGKEEEFCRYFEKLLRYPIPQDQKDIIEEIRLLKIIYNTLRSISEGEDQGTIEDIKIELLMDNSPSTVAIVLKYLLKKIQR